MLFQVENSTNLIRNCVFCGEKVEGAFIRRRAFSANNTVYS